MALYSLRLRRTLTLTSSLIKHQRGRALSTIPAISDSPPSSILHNLNSQPTHDCPFQSRSFRSSSFSLSSSRSYNNNNDDDKISPDTILFEGCDYNHWLITMDFPKDPKPTAEEMVETYVQTLAKVVGSVEEAKKKMYACSTTTYTGFQAVMTEEMSEKFRGLPGVVFILPDSYIDPVNKEYGGDKYINGTIIPRPPPVQYGRSGGRYGDRNRNYDRRDSPRGPMPNQQGNPAYNRQGSMQGDGRNYGPPQNFPPQQNYGPPQNLPPQQNYGPPQNLPPQQNYGPTGQGERRDPMPVNNRDYAPGGRDTYQGDRRDPMPSYQGSYNQGERGNYHPQEQRNFLQGDQRDYAPAERRDYAPPEQRDFRGDNRNYAPPQGAGGTYGQGAGGTYGQGMGSGYGQSYPGHGEAQRFSQVEQRNDMQGEKRNYPPMGHTGTDQGKF